jgi:hypothetical protein
LWGEDCIYMTLAVEGLDLIGVEGSFWRHAAKPKFTQYLILPVNIAYKCTVTQC